MKKHIFFLLLCLAAMLLAAATLTAQRRIDLRHNGASTLFTEFQPALDAAVNGDTIYLPGTTFTGGFNSTKKLAIIGVGIHPDSTAATNKTQFYGTLYFDVGSSGSFITGVKCAGIGIQNGVENIKITRCAGSVSGGSNCLISECIGSISSQSNSQIFNNLAGEIDNMTNCIIRNNVCMRMTYCSCYYGCSYGTLSNCLVENNLILSFNPLLVFCTNQSQNSSNCSFLNNIWSGGVGIPNGSFGNGNTGSGNIQETNFDAQFVNFVAANFTVDNFHQWDLHLTNPAYNTGGTDGTPIGIYGGMFPWKAGSVPFTPHINLKVIAPTTNTAGQLPITIRAKAQGN